MKLERLVAKRNKVHLIFDNGEGIYLRYDTVLKFGLKKNDEITDTLLAGLQNEDYRLQIKELSFKLLSRRMHSAAELKRKLLLKKLPSERIDETIADLLERKYLDDFKFAEKYAEEMLKNNKKGLIKIKSELLGKGVDKKTADAVMAKYENSETLIDNALLIARRKISSSVYTNLTAVKKKEKLFRFLISKGYSQDVIRITIDKLHLNNQDPLSFD